MDWAVQGGGRPKLGLIASEQNLIFQNLERISRYMPLMGRVSCMLWWSSAGCVLPFLDQLFNSVPAPQHGNRLAHEEIH